ncbi:MAG: hypothetical protein ACREMB_16685 [Candidatus Rokuibacteriota bacterium]
MTGRWRLALLLPAALGIMAGCAAGARRVGDALVIAGKGYRVVPPKGWERIPSDADVAFHHPGLGAGLMAHGTCEGAAPRRTLPVLARHLRFGLRDVEGLEEARLEVAGRHGIRSRFTARLDGIPVAVGAVTVQARGCVYDLVVVTPPGRLAEAAPAFEAFADSFALMEDR